MCDFRDEFVFRIRRSARRSRFLLHFYFFLKFNVTVGGRISPAIQRVYVLREVGQRVLQDAYHRTISGSRPTLQSRRSSDPNRFVRDRRTLDSRNPRSPAAGTRGTLSCVVETIKDEKVNYWLAHLLSRALSIPMKGHGAHPLCVRPA